MTATANLTGINKNVFIFSLLIFLPVLNTLSPAQVQVSGPDVVEQNAAFIPANGEEYYGAVTEGPGEYFAVWMGIGGGLDSDTGVYAQRIKPDGTFLVPGSLKIFRDTDRVPFGVPSVAWNGKVYLVLWHELDMLYGARVQPDGTVLDPDGFPIDVFNSIDLHPAIASDGENFLVVQAGQNGDLVGVRVGGDGTVLDSNPITISSGASGLGIPQIGWGAGVYTVVWAEAPNQAIRGARITPNGLLLDPGGFNISGGGADVDAFIDFDGQNFYVTWTRDVGGNDALMAAHVTPGGQVASGPMTLLSGSSFGIIALPHVSWNGTHHLITITTGEPLFSNSDLYAMRVDVDGVPVEMPFPVSTIEGESAVPYGVATVDGQWFMQWEGSEIISSAFHYDTEGARVAADGNVLDQPHLEVATNAAWQLSSACAFDGTNFLCVFDDEREGPNNYHENLYAVRMNADGEPIDATGFPLDTSFGTIQRDPDMVFGGGQHAVAYVHEGVPVAGIRLVRVLPDGTVLDPGGITVGSNGGNGTTQNPRIASSSTHYCVVWHGGDLMYAVVGHDGTVVVPPTDVPGANNAVTGGFEVASDGDGFVTTWPDFSGFTLKSNAINAAGAISQPQLVHSGFGGTFLAWNGQNYLLAWAEFGDNSQQFIKARPLGPTGLPIGPVITIDGPLSFGSTVLGLWADGGGFDLLTTGLKIWDVNPDGTPVGEAQIFSLNSGGFEPYWCQGRAGQLLFTNSRWHTNPYNGLRVQVQMVDYSSSIIPGDVNGDGTVNLLDVQPFVALLISGGYQAEADINGDGIVDLLDVAPFVQQLAN